VGMLCRDYTEDDVQQLFSTFGHVEDVSILRNAEGKSKGTCVCMCVHVCACVRMCVHVCACVK